VFALLGLVADQSIRSYLPDYRKPPERIYLEFTTILLSQRPDLWALSVNESSNRSRLLPSWVHDWGSVLHEPLGYDLQRGQLFSASGYTLSQVEFANCGLSLVVGTLVLDSVSTVMDMPDRVDIAAMRSCWNFCRQLIERPEFVTYGGLEENLEAAFKTMVADTKRDSTGTQLARTTNFRSQISKMIETVTADSSIECETAAVSFPREVRPMITDFISDARRILSGRRLFISSKGYLGVAPAAAREGDAVCVLRGGAVPFIIRKHEGENCFTLVRESYVHGVMDGEVLQKGEYQTENGEICWEEIEIR
jgi:hypothetical protein